MSMQSVINAGKGLENEQVIHWINCPWWAYAVALVGVILSVFILIFAEREFKALSATVLVITGLFFLALQDVEEIDHIGKWQKEIATPYVNSLPVMKREIVFIKIDPEMTTETRGSHLFGSGYLTNKRIEKTPLTVSFKSNGRVVTRTDWYDTTMTLTKESKPYIEYQYVKRDLGHGFKKGMYNVRVHLPESYEFTDIK